MKLLFIMLFSFSCFADHNFGSVRQGLTNNNTPMDETFALSSPTKVSTASVGLYASVDLFSNKAGNQYAESRIVHVVSSAAMHVEIGKTAPTATTASSFIPANTDRYILIDTPYVYFAAIADSATATVYTTELY